MPINTDQLLDWVRNHPLPDKRIIPVCLWGERGVGKTSFISSFCRARNLGLRVYIPSHDESGSDVVGMSFIDTKLERTVYARPMWLPSEDDPAVFERQGVIFIDELNRSSESVSRGLMEPLGEGRIEHSGWKLPTRWSFLCAANPPEPGYKVETLDDALMNRLLHVPMGFDAVRWSAWAQGSQVHSDVIAFTALHHEDVVAPARPELPKTVKAIPTPRTIEYLSRLYEPGMSRELLEMIAVGLIGRQAAATFLKQIDDPQKAITPEQIMTNEYQAAVSSLRAEGRDDLLDASVTLLLAFMQRYSPSEDAADRAAGFVMALGPEKVRDNWARVIEHAPHWSAALQEAFKRLNPPKQA